MNKPAVMQLDSAEARYESARQMVATTGRASVPILQRSFRLAYFPAVALMAMLEARGVVSAPHPRTGDRVVLERQGA